MSTDEDPVTTRPDASATGGLDPDPPDPGAAPRPLDVAAIRARYELGIAQDDVPSLCDEVDRLGAFSSAKALGEARWQVLSNAWKALAQARASVAKSPVRSPEWYVAVDRVNVALCFLRSLGIDPESL